MNCQNCETMPGIGQPDYLGGWAWLCYCCEIHGGHGSECGCEVETEEKAS